MTKALSRIDLVAAIVAITLAYGCGGGCGGCGIEPIPGGFPATSRNPNAGQLRITSGAVAKIEADPAALLSGLGASTMPGVIQFEPPVNCTGGTPTCCPTGSPMTPCGPVNIDLNQQAGDTKRLELRPAQEGSRLDLVVRARVQTGTDIPVKLPVFGDCGVKIDSTVGTIKDIQIDAPITFTQDTATGTTRLVVGAVTITNLTTEDLAVTPGPTGNVFCIGATLTLSFFIDLLVGELTGTIQQAIQDEVCKTCESGDVAECGSFATACTGKVCRKGNECLQELGISGRAPGTAILGSLSPGTTGAIDIYEVAGGYGTTNSGGIALGLLGGMLPGGVARDRCGPPAGAPPQLPAITPSAFFQGNTRPDTGATYDLGLGIHSSQLAHFAHAAYDGGFLCLTITGDTITQLTTDTFSLISRSLGNLFEGNSPMALGLRPQSPPVITLGKNTFMDDGMGNMTLVDPLLDLQFTDLEIDFFAAVDYQFIRVFTVVADVRLPIGLQVTGMGELQPVIGDVSDAFTNITVTHSEAVTETPQMLADVFPSLLDVALPTISGGLSPISLPALGGLNLAVNDITGVPQNPGGSDISYLALFANLAPAAFARPVDTQATITDVYEPERALYADPRTWRGARQPAVTLQLTGHGLEWSYRLNDGFWSAWSPHATQLVSSRMFWLTGTHRIEVRAREVRKPETIDLTPVVLEVDFGHGVGIRRAPPVRGFHGQPSGAGCDCQSSGGTTAWPFAIVLLAIAMPVRRMRRRLRRAIGAVLGFGARSGRRLGIVTWLALALVPACDCSSNPCGEVACLPGDIEHGALGRWTSIAGDDQRVMVATYDHTLGDLVAIDVTDPAARTVVAVDGIPNDVTPTHDPSSYRKGVEEPGPDVGAWTSIAIAGGHAMIAYQDRDAGSLRFAYERSPGEWTTSIVDDGEGEGSEAGRYASIAIDQSGRPVVAYIVLGIDDGMGGRETQLRIARAGKAEPNTNDWTTAIVAAGRGSCGGLCGAGEACIAGAMDQRCVAVTTDCTRDCSADEACVAGRCTPAFGEPTVADIGTGTGLFASLVVLPDGRLAVAYYDRVGRALKLAVETAGTFTEATLDAPNIGDRGPWASAVADATGTVHIAYQDAIGDQLMYTTWNGTRGTPEVVDDGQRMGDRPHPVGAAATIYLANGVPTIAYQDGMTADVYTATKSGTTWSVTPMKQGPLLDGFSIAVTTAHAGATYFAWDQLDPARTPANDVFVERR